MSYNIRFPNINSSSTPEQVMQIRTYLHQLVEQLNFALTNIESVNPSVMDASVNPSVMDAKGNPVSVSEEEKEDPVSTFNQVKALIIKSSDIVNAYYEEINEKIKGLYVAESDFGIYTKETAAKFSKNSTNIEALFTNTQTIASDVKSVKDVLVTGSDVTKIIGANAWVNIGVLDYDDNGYPLYGMEIGQTNSENGVDIGKKFAQYRSDGVHLYDQNGTEVACISNNKLHITFAEITGKLTLGEFIVDIPRGFTLKWVGGDS